MLQAYTVAIYTCLIGSLTACPSPIFFLDSYRCIENIWLDYIRRGFATGNIWSDYIGRGFTTGNIWFDYIGKGFTTAPVSHIPSISHLPSRFLLIIRLP